MRILIVEDNDMMRLALERALEQQGHVLHSVTNGEHAIQTLFTEEFDVVITDFRMPRMGGLELTAIIRTLFGDSLKIIGMSSSDDCEDQFLNVGTNAYLTKPIDSEELNKVIDTFGSETACPIITAH